MRAREPDRCGFLARSGARIYYEVFGTGPVTVLLLPAWAIVHSRMWKMQVPYLARYFRVVTFDPRGNGRSDSPPAPADYSDVESAEDAIAVLDAVGVDVAVIVGLSKGAGTLLRLAAGHPERVSGAVFLAPAMRLDQADDPVTGAFEDPPVSDEGWAKYNAQYWRRDLTGFAEFFFGEVFPEAHSSKQIEDAVGWAAQTDPETLIATARAPYLCDDAGQPIAAELAAQVSAPCLVVQGDDDRITGAAAGFALAAALGCGVEVFRGAGHCVQARHPVRFNLLLRRFVDTVGVAG